MRQIRLKLRLAIASLVLAALAACAVTPQRSITRADQAHVQAFQGAWAYAQTCEWMHRAQLDLAVAPGGGMRGTWADGTVVRGENGELQGTLRDGRLYLRFCRDSAKPGDTQACPAFGDESAYLVAESERLRWYRRFGQGERGTYRPYVTLYRVGKDGKFPKDDCKGADAGGPTFVRNEGEPIDVVIGSHRVAIAQNYFRFHTPPRSKERIELELRGLDLSPAPRVAPPLGGLEGADLISVTASTTASDTPQRLAERRLANLKRVDTLTSAELKLRDKGDSVFGLTPYYLNFDRLRAAVVAAGGRPEIAANPRAVYNLDWYFAPRAPGAPATFIRCTPREVTDGVFIDGGRLARSEPHNSDVLATCEHTFEIPAANLIVAANYPRALLSRWQAIEHKLQALLAPNTKSRK